jgi:hypothetical protein
VIAKFVGSLEIARSEETRFAAGAILRALGSCIDQEVAAASKTKNPKSEI